MDYTLEREVGHALVGSSRKTKMIAKYEDIVNVLGEPILEHENGYSTIIWEGKFYHKTDHIFFSVYRYNEPTSLEKLKQCEIWHVGAFSKMDGIDVKSIILEMIENNG